MPQQLANDLAFHRAHILAARQIRKIKTIYIQHLDRDWLMSMEICDEPCPKCIDMMMRATWPKPEKRSREPSAPHGCSD